jgi:hypothetical protein
MTPTNYDNCRAGAAGFDGRRAGKLAGCRAPAFAQNRPTARLNHRANIYQAATVCDTGLICARLYEEFARWLAQATSESLLDTGPAGRDMTIGIVADKPDGPCRGAT